MAEKKIIALKTIKKKKTFRKIKSSLTKTKSLEQTFTEEIQVNDTQRKLATTLKFGFQIKKLTMKPFQIGKTFPKF